MEQKNQIPKIENFPEVTEVDIALNHYPVQWFNDILSKATEYGFDMYNPNKWIKRFGELFYKGGEVNINKKLEAKYINSGFRMLSAIIGSWSPKHEHKSAVCAYILYSIEG